MIDYTQELKKFKPAVGVETDKESLIENDVKDITDLVEEMVRIQLDSNR